MSPKRTGLVALFSSPELKAQVSFSDQNLSAVRPQTTGPISTKLGTNHL